MTGNVTLGRPYARASFFYSCDLGLVDEWAIFLRFLSDITGNQDLLYFLKNPQVDKQKKAQVLWNLCESVQVKNGDAFIQLIAHYGRLDCFKEISDEFNRLVSDSQNDMDIVISSPYPITKMQAKNIIKNLANIYPRKQMVLTTTIKPELIGGYTVNFKDTVIDASIRGRLQRMAEALNH